MDELIEMPTEGQTRIGPRNDVLDGGWNPLREGVILGVVWYIEKHWDLGVSATACSKRINKVSP